MWAFATLGTIASGQTTALRLIPGAELLRPMLQPGTLAQEPPAQSSAPKLNPWDSGLHIEILKGDRGVNIIKKKTAVTPVVEVKDRNNLPVAGVLVLFSSPSDGPSVTFLNGERSFSAMTDANGQAAATGVKPLNTGSFQLHVSASYQSETATATIEMTNFLTAADASSGGSPGAASAGAGLSHTAILVIVGVAAAAAVGVGVGLSGHGSSSPSTSTTATIGAGSGGTVGAPH
jgi:hypothetical protein